HWMLPLAIWMLSPLAALAAAKGFPALGSLADPLGSTAVIVATSTLTPAEQVGWHVTLSGTMLTNRLIWLAAGGLSLALAAAFVSRRSGTVWVPALGQL